MKKLVIIRLLALPVFALAAFEAGADDAKDLLAKLIRLHGFQCPSIQAIDSYGNDAYGKVVKIWCGQGDYRNNPIYFRVTETGTLPNVGYRVEPWRD